MLVRLLQPRNAFSPMLVTLSGIVILVRLLHMKKVPRPMFVTPSGNVILVRPVQWKNAYSPLLVTLLGITTVPSFEAEHASSFVLLESSYTSPSSTKPFNALASHGAPLKFPE